MRRSWLVIPLLVGLAAGCGVGPQAGPQSGPWVEPVPPDQQASEASGAPDGPPEITLAFGGDVHFVEYDGGVPNRTWRLLDDPDTAFGPVAELFHDADLSMINLETAVTIGGTPEPKTFLFRAPPEAFDAVRAAGIDVVSLANNHALDYGRDGLADTLAYAEAAGVAVVGAVEDADAAYAPWVVEVKGVRVAVLGFSQVWELWERWRATGQRSGIAYAMDGDRALRAVRTARQEADVVVVYMHWGQEGNPCPIAEMEDFAVAAARAGADIVVGTHAHQLLGDGWLGQTYVHYGLGNFLWWRDDRFSNDTGVLWITLQGDQVESAELRPAVISRQTGQPIPVTGEEADGVLRQVADLRECTNLADAPPH
jgi:poly-gamma-glutamate capsule biosynthesis protein CapA/YwtB (metallophosphatase superfamily)